MRNIRFLSSLFILIICGTLISFSQTGLRGAVLSLEHKSKLDAPKIMQFDEPAVEQKSTTLAVLYSVLLPGMGELYAGSFETGKYYLMADAGLWLTYGGFQLHGQWLRQDARSFAQQHAQTNADGKDDQFEVNLGNFNTVADYNEAKLRDRDYNLVYDPNSNYAWKWDSDANRLQYKDLRIRSDQVFQNSKFVLGALVLNRIISAFSAGRAVAAYNKSLAESGNWRINATVSGGILSAHGVELRLTKEF